MKKFLFSILMLCLAYTNASAQNTLQAVDLSAEAGDDVYLEFNLTNAAKIRTVEFKLYLPEGVTIGDLNSVQLNGERLSAGDDHVAKVTHPGDYYKFLVSSMENTPFTGNDGVVFSVIINIANTVAEGAHSIFVKDLLLTNSETDEPYETASIESTLTITGVSDGKVKLNENTTTLPIAKSGANVVVTRTINPGVWSTICLPFDMDETQIISAFGDDVEFCEFKSVTKSGDNYTIKFSSFDKSEGLGMNTPCLIKTTSKITTFTVNGVDIDAEETPSVKKSSNYFYGTNKAGKVLEKDYLFLNGNKIYYSKGTTTIKGFRGYFFVNGYSSASAPEIELLIDGEEATNIEGLSIVGEDGRIYNLKGQHVENPTEKGVYIKNGKKFVIK